MLNEPFSQQPFLHDRTICIHAPSMWVSGSDGQMREGVDGVYVADQRIVQEFVVRIDDREPDEMAVSLDGASAACFLSDARTVTDYLTPDPKSRVTRSRRATAAGGTEDIVITNRNRHAMTFTLTIMLLGDATPIATIKNGISHEPQLEYIQLLDGQRWTNEHRSTEVHFQPAPLEWTGSQARWQCEVTPGDSFLLSLQLTTTQTSSALAEVAVRPPWSVTSLPLATTTGDALRSLLARSMHDVSALLMSDRARPDDVFVAAGAPWYLTLFGRDSLWAARLMLPVLLTSRSAPPAFLPVAKASPGTPQPKKRPDRFCTNCAMPRPGLGCPRCTTAPSMQRRSSCRSSPRRSTPRRPMPFTNCSPLLRPHLVG